MRRGKKTYDFNFINANVEFSAGKNTVGNEEAKSICFLLLINEAWVIGRITQLLGILFQPTWIKIVQIIIASPSRG